MYYSESEKLKHRKIAIDKLKKLRNLLTKSQMTRRLDIDKIATDDFIDIEEFISRRGKYNSLKVTNDELSALSDEFLTNELGGKVFDFWPNTDVVSYRFPLWSLFYLDGNTTLYYGGSTTSEVRKTTISELLTRIYESKNSEFRNADNPINTNFDDRYNCTLYVRVIIDRLSVT